MGGTLFLIAVIAIIVGLIIWGRVRRSRSGESFGRPISIDKGGYNPPPTPEESLHRPPPPAPMYPGVAPTFAPRRNHGSPPVNPNPVTPTAGSYSTLRARQDYLAQQEADLARRRALLAQQQADDNFTTGLVTAAIIADEIADSQPVYADPAPADYVDPNPDDYVDPNQIVAGGGTFGGGGASADWVDPNPQPDPAPAYQPDPQPVYEAPQPTYDPPAPDPSPSYDPPSYDPGPDTSYN